MTELVHYDLIAGETFHLELRFPFEDLSGATAFHSADPSLGGFSAIISGSDTVILSNLQTADFPVGTWPVLLWLNWSAGDVLDEVLAEISLVVRRPVGDAV